LNGKDRVRCWSATNICEENTLLIASLYKPFMFRPRQLLFPTIIILLLACKNEHSYTYAIKDFRKSLQPHLIKIVSKGIVMYYDSSLRNMATDKELIQLSQSEHPVLRASAFREMLHRKSFNHFDILMNHLDDTATVATDAGEWGIRYTTVSDDILQEAKWKSKEDKNKTINEVITSHNYLKSAYTILLQIEPQEKYYTFIKDMATRKRNYDEELGEKGFDEIEYALYGLAKFKKKDDIKIIKKQLLSNCWRISELSFRLMSEFPDTAYLQVYERYYPHNFYRSLCRNQNSSNAVDFINSIATYKNQRSSNILDSILNKNFINCPVDTNYIMEELVYAIWNNQCEAYSKLRKQIEKRAEEYEKNKIELPSDDSINFREDSSEEKITWW
jgi:hypothetical protein